MPKRKLRPVPDAPEASPEETAAMLEQAAKGPPEGMTERQYGPALSKLGDTVFGTYEGPGKPRKVRKKMVETFLIKTPNRGVVELLASVQIAQFLETVHKGQTVWIQRGAQVPGGKGKVNQYRFAVDDKK